ncbi:hypothetical protein [Marichromatium sp. AB31]|uniref:hypothetical protein n=1 Tax=Marichromatium sp. AB31 TaxID=2483362 RepID=UPI000F3CC68A|nr:hypothetical protein [Marichromatium sp. AB31]RNE90824.1 hypothetical protein EBL84_06035 [Marichromatium sp. AB31]
MNSTYQWSRLALAIVLGVATGLALWWIFTPPRDLEALEALHRAPPPAIAVVPPRAPETVVRRIPEPPPPPPLPEDAPPQLEALMARYRALSDAGRQAQQTQQQAASLAADPAIGQPSTTTSTPPAAARPATPDDDTETRVARLRDELIAYSQRGLSGEPPALGELAGMIEALDDGLRERGRDSVLDLAALAGILRTSERMVELNGLIQREAARGEQADIARLRQYTSELESLAPQLNRPVVDLSSLRSRDHD